MQWLEGQDYQMLQSSFFVIRISGSADRAGKLMLQLCASYFLRNENVLFSKGCLKAIGKAPDLHPAVCQCPCTCPQQCQRIMAYLIIWQLKSHSSDFYWHNLLVL
jgi:hypothetical protein